MTVGDILSECFHRHYIIRGFLDQTKDAESGLIPIYRRRNEKGKGLSNFPKANEQDCSCARVNRHSYRILKCYQSFDYICNPYSILFYSEVSMHCGLK